MLIRNIADMPVSPMDVEGAQGVEMAVMVGRDDGAPHFALRQINVAAQGHSPRHQHDYEHEVFVVEGSGQVLLEGEFRPLKAGDVVYVPANEEHQFRAGALGLRFLCLVPVEQNCGGETPGS